LPAGFAKASPALLCPLARRSEAKAGGRSGCAAASGGDFFSVNALDADISVGSRHPPPGHLPALCFCKGNTGEVHDIAVVRALELSLGNLDDHPPIIASGIASHALRRASLGASSTPTGTTCTIT